MLLRVLWELVVSSRHGRVLALLSHTLITPYVSEASNLWKIGIKKKWILLEDQIIHTNKIPLRSQKQGQRITSYTTLSLKMQKHTHTIYCYPSKVESGSCF